MGMGNPFLIFILLFVSTTLAVTDEQVKFLEEVNKVRGKYANEYNVPNMHKLFWSSDLQKILGGNYALILWRFTMLVSYDGVTQSIDDEMNKFLNKTDKIEALTHDTVDRLELLNPFQTVIACGMIPSPFGAGNVLVCLVGPERKAKLWDVDTKPSEPAGSGCPPRYQNENGLCAPEDPSKVSLFGFQDDFLPDINKLRGEYAKQYNVPNMHRLVWNEELTKIAESLDYSKNWGPYARRMWRHCYFTSYRNPIDLIRKKLDAFIGKSAEERNKKLIEMNARYMGDMGELEVLSPRQSEIGCARMWAEITTTLNIVCLVGTRGRAELWDFDSKSTEEPGSACPEKYKNENGLCTPVDPTPVSIYGNHQVFMKELNEARRKYAKEYNVPNMHQMVWSKDLVKIVEPLDWSVPWPSAHKTWRFSRVFSYRNIIENIEDIMGRLLQKNETEKTAWVATTNDSNADLIELLNPLQTVVGCAEKTDEVTILACLIGREGSLSLFDFSKNSTDAPGSSCSKHYRNEDGLCVPVNAADVSYFGFREDFLSGLNELRRSIAKKYHIPNMHELKWHQELADTAQSDSWPSDHPSWRYTSINSYRDLKTIEDEVNAFISKTEDEKKSFITDNESLKDLELMNPEQTLIGCGKKKDELNALTCLIGTQGKWPEVTFDANSTVTAGSKCVNDYENSDGLCTFVSSTPPPLPPQKVVPQRGVTQRVERITQRIPEAASETAAQQADKDEPDTATTGFSPYLMISFPIILFLY